MDVREKLIDLLTGYSIDTRPDVEYVVDRLISNGVTVQEWVDVKDRLPEVGGYVVCIAKRNPFSRFMPMVARIEKNGLANPIT